jgi:hypothetical protein
LRDANAEVERAGARVVAIGMGGADRARALREEFSLPFLLLVDEDRVAYRAAGVGNAGVVDFVRPAFWRAGRRARQEGFRQVSNGPHPLQLGGTFLLGPGDVDLFVHRGRLGEEAPVADVLAAIGRERS